MKSAPLVVALIVSHDGARWLPQVIEGVRAQSAPLRRVVAVDTGSLDDSRRLLTAAFGAQSVIAASAATSFPAAVTLGFDAAPDAEWLWILHDDSRPDAGALAALLDYVERDPRVDIVGPKLREWPSLRRILEVGVTISGTGRRETGLERGEYDQGQHDHEREVLAVHSAGMLVRRTVLAELGGFDEQLPIFCNDLDLGWRAARAGFRTVAVPSAVVFHAEAAHRGVRRTPLTGRHTHFAERRAALFTLLANVPARSLPWQAVRILFGSLLRVLGFLATRAVGQALDELAAVLSLYASPGQLRRARRERERLVARDPERVRRLLAPWWVPYRHGLDFISDLLAALTQQAQDVAERRRLARPGSLERQLPVGATDRRRRYVPDDQDEFPEPEPSLLLRFLTSPIALAISAFLVISGWSLRTALSGDFGSGLGALAPSPTGDAPWWRLHVEGWHALGQGTSIPAPPYVMPFAIADFLLPGESGVVIAALMWLAVPVAFWGAWRLLRVSGHLLDQRGMPPMVLLVGAAAYALAVVSTGAWSSGRFGVVAAAAVLPWLAHAALGFAEPSPARRWRAGWRAGVLLSALVCFAPQFWLVGAAIAGLIFATITALSLPTLKPRSAWGPPVLALALPGGLLAPWWLPLVLQGAAPGLLFEAGRLPFVAADGLDLVLGQLGVGAAPRLVGGILPLLAVAALVPRSTRLPVLLCWMVACSGALVAALLGRVRLELPTLTITPSLGVISVFLSGAAIVAITLAAQGLLQSTSSDGTVAWGRGLVALFAAVPVAGLVWAGGYAPDRLAAPERPDIPEYMTQSSLVSPDHGVLVVRGSVAHGLRYVVRRGDGLTVGEDEIVSLAPVDASLTATVRALASSPAPEQVAGLAAKGIEYVVLTAPADGRVAAGLDAVSGLTPVSAENRATRAWQVDQPPQAGAVAATSGGYRPLLVGGQLVALVVALIMCGPGRKRTDPEGRELDG